ncbi:MAG: transcription-repair coupling factor [Saprospiraceae bacterium]|nr:transcription-repair coupling factor [Candidatus Vicinibacter proximus]MBL7822931.1 transcription-repair coupling factor [Saprospiraceae bacterium]MCC6844092.1 transcription-repair coupling factor [Saprospiraceae bacterium]
MQPVADNTSLESLFLNDPNAQKLYRLIKEEGRRKIWIQGLSGSRDSFLLFSSLRQFKCTQLVIANDKEEAAYLQNDLEQFCKERELSFFPDSFKRPMSFEDLDPFQVQQRIEAVAKIRSDNSHLIISYPEALFEKILAPSRFEASRVDFIQGELLDVDEVIDKLVKYGFVRADFVFEPGQFSIRGGIIDIFSFASDHPYRIELNDIEIESIRSFDTQTQMSIQKLGRFSIIPNLNTEFENAEKKSLLEILPEQSILWIKDEQTLMDKLQTCFESAEKFGEKMIHYEEERTVNMIRDRAFVYPGEIAKELKNFPLVYFDTKPTEVTDLTELRLNTKPQPSINKNFNILIEIIKDFNEKNIIPYICTSNVQQIERFYRIFEDLKADIQFQPALISIREGFIDADLKLACFTDHQIFSRFHGFKLKQGFSAEQAVSLKVLRELQPGDFVSHLDHGIGRFAGLEKINVNGQMQEAVRLIYRNHDILYVSIHSLHKISKYVGQEGTEPMLHKLGSDQWKILKQKTKAKVKEIAKELIKLYAARKASKGFAFAPDNYLQTELEASFIYEDTPDQSKATQDVKNDMEKPYPMDRLICGDVGFGKTEVAIRAAFKCIQDGKQVAILVPTTILALQHYRTISERLKEFPVDVDYVSRFRSAKEKTAILKKLKEGSLDLIIGTHSLLNKKTEFKDLGLLIIDEEQKFGVASKEKLRQFKVNVDTLTLTATPIPRTLQFSLMAARDLSVINTPPPNRQPIHTERRVFNDELIKDAILNEIYRGGQVFFVHNRVKNLAEVGELIRKLCPDVEVAIAHGQMDAEKLEKVLVDFIEHKYDVLVCTNIIETGLDIPNANTIIINNAQNFGLSDLHQLRGRVGRSNRKAYCYLFAPPSSALTLEAKKRLKTLEEFSDLGSGFNISMRDLDIRGAGNLLGGEQSGFISDIGYETYQRILEEAIFELKEGEYKSLFEEEGKPQKTYVRDTSIDSDIEMFIPDSYVTNVQERLNLYQQLDKLEKEEDIEKFSVALKDRFGPIPSFVEELFEGLRTRWIAKEMGFERIILKKKKLQAYFISNPQSSYFESPYFKSLLKIISTDHSSEPFILKQSNQLLILIRENVKTLRQAKTLLVKLHDQIKQHEE